MNCTVIGYKKVNFTPSDSTTLINGINLYVEYKDKSEALVGDMCERIFITEKKLGDYTPTVGDEIDVIYNRYGKPDRIVCL